MWVKDTRIVELLKSKFGGQEWFDLEARNVSWTNSTMVRNSQWSLLLMYWQPQGRKVSREAGRTVSSHGKLLPWYGMVLASQASLGSFCNLTWVPHKAWIAQVFSGPDLALLRENHTLPAFPRKLCTPLILPFPLISPSAIFPQSGWCPACGHHEHYTTIAIFHLFPSLALSLGPLELAHWNADAKIHSYHHHDKYIYYICVCYISMLIIY